VLTVDSFNKPFARLGIKPDPDVYHGLIDAYSSPDRHYHNIKHIAECLGALTRNEDLADRPDEITIALWFHDAVYDTRKNDNEESSAAWARDVLTKAGLCSESASRIFALITTTKHDAVPASPDERLLVDIDLGILGQPPSVFAAYDAAIRREYDWVSWEQYRSGRTAVLRLFLHRPTIFSTERFIALYEHQARENIAHAISKLERGTRY
jgi:predicted metal-dependent HD superfamily phosphohydrolase